MMDILDPELHNPEDGLNAGLGFYTRNIFTQKKIWSRTSCVATTTESLMTRPVPVSPFPILILPLSGNCVAGVIIMMTNRVARSSSLLKKGKKKVKTLANNLRVWPGLADGF